MYLFGKFESQNERSRSKIKYFLFARDQMQTLQSPGGSSLEKLKIYETCNFHVNLDLQDL